MTDKNDSLTAKAEAAFKQASKKVIEIARQTNTPVILWEDNKAVEISGEQLNDLERKLEN